MERGKQTDWITMKQVVTRTGLKATTISRYKDEFSEYVIHRLHGQLLEFDENSVPILKYIYELYKDRREGRRTTEKVRDLLQREYGAGEPPIIDVIVPGALTTSSDNKAIAVLLGHLQQQDQRMASMEIEQQEAKNREIEILEQNIEILNHQQEMKQFMTERLTYISEIAATRREQKQGLWSKLFPNFYLW